MFLWGLIFTEDFGKIHFIPMQICNQETEHYSKGYKIQKTNIRWASLFPRTNRCKCCDSAPRPDSWGQSFDQSWPHWRCRCGKGAWQTRDMAAFIERGWYCLFIYLFIVYFSVVSRVELPQSFVWQKWRHCECSYLGCWCSGLLPHWQGASSPQGWAFTLSRQFWSNARQVFVQKNERGQMLGVLCFWFHLSCIYPLGSCAFFRGSWNWPLLQAQCWTAGNQGLSYFGHLPHSKLIALWWDFCSKAGGRGRETTTAFQGRKSRGNFWCVPKSFINISWWVRKMWLSADLQCISGTNRFL